MPFHRCNRTDTGDHARKVRVYGQDGSVPAVAAWEMRQVGANPRVRPVLLVEKT